jgi:hypothetical protein
MAVARSRVEPAAEVPRAHRLQLVGEFVGQRRLHQGGMRPAWRTTEVLAFDEARFRRPCSSRKGRPSVKLAVRT